MVNQAFRIKIAHRSKKKKKKKKENTRDRSVPDGSDNEGLNFKGNLNTKALL